MKVIRIVMVLALMLALATISMAQTDSSADQSMNQSVSPSQPATTQNQPSSTQSFTATVQQGPVIRFGLPSADVFVNGKLAVRIPASAGGLRPIQRARIVAQRLNSAFASGISWQDARVVMSNGMYTVYIGSHMIVTADAHSAIKMHTSSGRLANRWASNTVVAMGGQPQTIAMNLQPVRTRVAGSMEQMGAMPWSTHDTKSVPLMFSTNGNQMGSVTVAGPQSALDTVGSVVVYESNNSQATVWTFVPITGTSTTGTLTRVAGVGLISLPSSLVPTGYQTGSAVTQMDSSMGAGWNDTINTSLRQAGVPIDASTKVVPLYSSDSSQVIGAAQIVGNANSVRRAQSVVVSSNAGMYQFSASPSHSMSASASAPQSMMHNVLISSIIMVAPQGGAPLSINPSGASATPAMTSPSSTAPSSTPEPGTSAPSTAPAPNSSAPGMSAPSTTPESGTSPNTTAPAPGMTTPSTTAPAPGATTPNTTAPAPGPATTPSTTAPAP